MPEDEGQHGAVELFRLAAIRAPAPETGAEPRIPLDDSGIVADDRRSDHRGDAWTLSLVEGNAILALDEGGSNELFPIGELDRFLGRGSDRVEPSALRTWIQNSAGSPAADIIGGEQFRRLRQHVHASLIAMLASGAAATLPAKTVRGQVLEALLRGVRLLRLVEELARPQGPQSPADVGRFLSLSIVVLPTWFPRPFGNMARPPAVADLKVVRLGPARYEPGAIAHIENVMAREQRTRTHRLLQQLETTATRESERTTELEHELATASQVEMQQETSRALSESTDVEAGISVSASYGPSVTVEADGRVARHASKEEASRSAAAYASETIQKARERVVERVKEVRTTRSLLETEETNVHGFDNATGEKHITGVYRWVDSVQDAWVDNYGKRLMLEFVVPEPAAFVRWALADDARGVDVGDAPARPTALNAPSIPLTPMNISDANYLELVALYGASDVPPAPASTVQLGLAFKGETDGEDLYLFDDTQSLTVPTGYQATGWRAHCVTWGKGGADGEKWMASVGVGSNIEQEGSQALAKNLSGVLSAEEGSVLPVVMLGRGMINLAVSVAVTCVLTAAGRARWQLAVYDAIMRAWRLTYEDWEVRKARAEAQAMGEEPSPMAGSSNPAANRVTERRELRRSVVHLLLGRSPDEGIFAEDAVVHGETGPPTLNLSVAAAERDTLVFLEQACEWSNMSWVHYPYYWAARDRWAQDATRESPDPPWAMFLSAGASRVLVPIRPGFESAVSLYLATGIIWSGGQVPTVGDPAYLGIAEEVAEALGTGSTPLERVPLEPVRLPTSLVWLQPTVDLNPA